MKKLIILSALLLFGLSQASADRHYLYKRSTGQAAFFLHEKTLVVKPEVDSPISFQYEKETKMLSLLVDRIRIVRDSLSYFLINDTPLTETNYDTLTDLFDIPGPGTDAPGNYETLENKPRINNTTIEGDHDQTFYDIKRPVQSDWNVNDESSLAFILNKPPVPPDYDLPIAGTYTLGGIMVDGTNFYTDNRGTLMSRESGENVIIEVAQKDSTYAEVVRVNLREVFKYENSAFDWQEPVGNSVTALLTQDMKTKISNGWFFSFRGRTDFGSPTITLVNSQGDIMPAFKVYPNELTQSAVNYYNGLQAASGAYAIAITDIQPGFTPNIILTTYDHTDDMNADDPVFQTTMNIANRINVIDGNLDVWSNGQHFTFNGSDNIDIDSKLDTTNGFMKFGYKSEESIGFHSAYMGLKNGDPLTPGWTGVVVADGAPDVPTQAGLMANHYQFGLTGNGLLLFTKDDGTLNQSIVRSVNSEPADEGGNVTIPITWNNTTGKPFKSVDDADFDIIDSVLYLRPDSGGFVNHTQLHDSLNLIRSNENIKWNQWNGQWTQWNGKYHNDSLQFMTHGGGGAGNYALAIDTAIYSNPLKIDYGSLTGVPHKLLVGSYAEGYTDPIDGVEGILIEELGNDGKNVTVKSGKGYEVNTQISMTPESITFTDGNSHSMVYDNDWLKIDDKKVLTEGNLGQGLEWDGTNEKAKVKVDGQTIVFENGALKAQVEADIPDATQFAKGKVLIDPASPRLTITNNPNDPMSGHLGFNEDGLAKTDANNQFTGTNTFNDVTVNTITTPIQSKLLSTDESGKIIATVPGEQGKVITSYGGEIIWDDIPLPQIANNDRLGVVKTDGNTIQVDADGLISTTFGEYVLQPATESTLGGIIPDGDNLVMDGNTLRFTGGGGAGDVTTQQLTDSIDSVRLTITNAINLLDQHVVHTAGNETIGGDKTFTNKIIASQLFFPDKPMKSILWMNDQHEVQFLEENESNAFLGTGPTGGFLFKGLPTATAAALGVLRPDGITTEMVMNGDANTGMISAAKAVNIANAHADSAIAQIELPEHYKGMVATDGDLPEEGNLPGDYYNVLLLVDFGVGGTATWNLAGTWDKFPNSSSFYPDSNTITADGLKRLSVAHTPVNGLFKVDLESDPTNNNHFDGTQTNINLGVYGKLPIANGGTGAATASDARTNLDVPSNADLQDVVTLLGGKVDTVQGKSLSSNDYTTSEKDSVARIGFKVDKVDGKGLSTHDFDDAASIKLETIVGNIKPNWQSAASASDGITNKPSFGATDPLRITIGVPPSYTYSIMAPTANQHGYFPKESFTKLAGIDTGAEVNVNADWTSASGDSHILHKPFKTIDPSTLQLIGDSVLTVTVSGGRTYTGTSPINVNDTIISISAATTTAAGSMSATDKMTLNNLSQNAVTNSDLPLTIANNKVSMPFASSSTNGYLQSSDWATFNNKLSTVATDGSTIGGNGTTTPLYVMGGGSAGKLDTMRTNGSYTGKFNYTANGRPFISGSDGGSIKFGGDGGIDLASDGGISMFNSHITMDYNDILLMSTYLSDSTTIALHPHNVTSQAYLALKYSDSDGSKSALSLNPSESTMEYTHGTISSRIGAGESALTLNYSDNDGSVSDISVNPDGIYAKFTTTNGAFGRMNFDSTHIGFAFTENWGGHNLGISKDSIYISCADGYQRRILTTVTTDATLTGNGTPSSPLSAVGGGGGGAGKLDTMRNYEDILISKFTYDEGYFPSISSISPYGGTKFIVNPDSIAIDAGLGPRRVLTTDDFGNINLSNYVTKTQYEWDMTVRDTTISQLQSVVSNLLSKIDEAPTDGLMYGRQNGEWVAINATPTPDAPIYDLHFNLNGGSSTTASNITWSRDGYTGMPLIRTSTKTVGTTVTNIPYTYIDPPASWMTIGTNTISAVANNTYSSRSDIISWKQDESNIINTINCSQPANNQPYIFTYSVSEGNAAITGIVINPSGGSTVTNVVIPSTIDGYPVKSIANNAFKSNTNLLGSFTIPSSVTVIGEWSFAGCYGITSFNLSGNLLEIKNFAFVACIGLSTVNIPTSVTTIGMQAFEDCLFTSVTIPNSVTTIKIGAFLECLNLTSVTIPASVTSIGEIAFGSCPSLTSVKLTNTTTLPSTEPLIFSYTPIANATLYVPNNTIRTLAQNTAPWSGFGSIVVSTTLEEEGFFKKLWKKIIK